jgi:hypothetical protein
MGMDRSKGIKTVLLILFMAALLLLLTLTNAWAVPSFARQTGLSCTVCHTVFPELRHFGRIFKLDGYTLSIGSPSVPWHPPIAAMIQASYTELENNRGILKNGVAPFDDAADSAVDKFNIPQQASIFYGGRIFDHLGAFSQLTYDGPGNDVALDLTDIRHARDRTLAGKDLSYGFTVNNSPTVEDVWNSTPTWGFPYGSSSVAPTPAAGALVDGGLDQQVGGVGAYFYWDNLIYGAFSLYRTTNDGIARPLGAGTTPDTVTDGAVPYWRLAVHHQWQNHAIELGTYGIDADVHSGSDGSGPTNHFRDYAFDVQYQYTGTRHLFSLQGTWIHERQEWDAGFPAGHAANPSDTLKTFKANVNYYYEAQAGIIGGSLGYFSITGDRDRLLYAPVPVDGSRTGRPESKGFILEGDFVFKNNYKFSLQYTFYNKFNGASGNYDGAGRDASDNNTLYLLAWLMF